MNDSFEKKLKELLPYIIIIGLLFLLLPLFMGNKEGAATYIIQIGAFPLIAAGCSFHYALIKKKHDWFICFIAPLFYALAALLYGMWRASWYTVLIYAAAYFLCGYLGQALSDLFASKGTKKKAEKTAPPQRTAPRRPRKVDVKKQQEEPAETFKAEDPSVDDSLDTSTTDDDIEAILEAIHNRKQQ